MIHLQCLAPIKGPINGSSYVTGVSTWAAFSLLLNPCLPFDTAEIPPLQKTWLRVFTVSPSYLVQFPSQMVLPFPLQLLLVFFPFIPAPLALVGELTLA